MNDNWSLLGVPDTLSSVLVSCGFVEPTPIQKAAIPAIINDEKDVLGAAETGSGKTLAFGIPLLEYILRVKSREERHSLFGLILTPTRELARQIEQHINMIGSQVGVKSVSIVGGLSVQKQQRIVRKVKPDIIVATPGRFWEFIEDPSSSYITVDNLHRLPFLVIDEADRMTEKGHFEDLVKIVNILNRQTTTEHDEEEEEEDFDNMVDLECISGNDIFNNATEEDEDEDDQTPIRRRTLVFSATLTFVHSRPERLSKESEKKKDKKSPKLSETTKKISQLISFLDLEPDNIKVIDLTHQGIGKPSSDRLEEFAVTCKKEDKDLFLYYAIREVIPGHTRGKTIVFCNSKDCLRRLVSVLKILRLNPVALHADLDQKRRMKAIESFSKSDNGILVASDVAARGLDINDISLVVHYQVPRTTESYVHRSGRTARGIKSGRTIVLVDPSSESSLYVKLCKSVNEGNPLDILPIRDEGSLKKMEQIVAIAKQIDILEHKFKKERDDSNWFLRMAKEADIDLEERDDLVIKSKWQKGGGKKRKSEIDDEDPLEEKEGIKLTNLKRTLDSMLGHQTKVKQRTHQTAIKTGDNKTSMEVSEKLGREKRKKKRGTKRVVKKTKIADVL